MNKLVYLAICLLLVFPACEKDENSPNDLTKLDLISAQSWLVQSAVLNPGLQMGGLSLTDIYTMVEACAKDDFFTFESTGVASLDQGANVCDASVPQTLSNSWSFNEDETKLTFTPPLQYNLNGVGVLELSEVNLVEISETELIISFQYTEPYLNTLQEVTITFRPQN